jgi:alpha-glucosidase
MRRLIPTVALALLLGCGGEGGGVPTELVLEGDGIRVRLAGTPPVLTISRADGEVVLEELPAADPAAVYGPAGIQAGEVTRPASVSSWFFPAIAVGPVRRPVAIRSVERSGDRVEAILSLPDGDAGPDREIRFTTEAVGEGAVRIRYEPVLADGERLTDLRLFASQSFRCGADERFYGLGHRPDSPEHRGHTRYHWTEEGGIGLGPDAPLGPHNPLPNGPSTTYFPIPYYVSSEGYALELDSTARSLFELCSEREDAIRLETWEPAIGITVIVGERGPDGIIDPLEVLERASAVLGRPEPPPRWIFAPWNDAIQGSEEVRRVAAVLRDNDIPSSVIWSEDWSGSAPTDSGITLVPDGWIDREVYPDVEVLADELHGQGFRFLSYYYPYLIEGTEDHDTARREGYLLRDANGKELRFFCVRDIVGQPDLSLPPAREWMKDRLRRSLALGFDGWMADFAEYTPFTALASDGTPGSLLHNQFPVQWQALNREVLEEARPDGDWVFFSRSGFSGARRTQSAVWGGDQNTSFEPRDGLPSAIAVGLGLGISGIPFYGHDIAGYISFTTPPSDRELFLRWAAAGAVSPVMRTHHGLSSDLNWSFDRDEATLQAYKRLARLHMELSPYLEMLAVDAVERGLPIMRHLFVHYPEDRTARQVHDQFLLGPDLLAAPVTERGATGRSVYLPEGRWRDWFDPSVVHQGPTTIEVEVPLGDVPLYVREGAVIPTLDPRVETLVPTIDAEVIGPEDARYLELRAFGGPPRATTLRVPHAGTFRVLPSSGGVRIEELERSAGAPPEIRARVVF